MCAHIRNHIEALEMRDRGRARVSERAFYADSFEARTTTQRGRLSNTAGTHLKPARYKERLVDDDADDIECIKEQNKVSTVSDDYASTLSDTIPKLEASREVSVSNSGADSVENTGRVELYNRTESTNIGGDAESASDSGKNSERRQSVFTDSVKILRKD